MKSTQYVALFCFLFVSDLQAIFLHDISFFSPSHKFTAMQEVAQRAMAKKRQQLISENTPENNENRKFGF